MEQAVVEAAGAAAATMAPILTVLAVEAAAQVDVERQHREQVV